MGGTVGVTIRRDNGETIKMARKTGSYKHLFLSNGWLDGNFNQAIDDYCKLFFEMKADFETNQHTKDYNFPMSPAYGWCNECAPIDYGLVVIDFKNKKIHSMQGYDSGNVATEGLVFLRDLDKSLVEKALTSNGWNVILEDRRTEDKQSWSITDFFGTTDYETCLKKLKATYNPVKQILDKFTSKQIPVDTIDSFSVADAVVTPKNLDFEVFVYETNVIGAMDFFKALKNDGFNFTSDELSMWKGFMQDNLVEYLEEGFDGEIDDDMTDDDYEKFLLNKEESLKKEIEQLFEINKKTLKKGT